MNEEIRNLSNEELGARLLDFVKEATGSTWSAYVPEEFCEDLNAIAEVEKVVVTERGLQTYGTCLRRVFGLMSDLLTSDQAALLATSSPRQRAEACLMALKVFYGS